MTIHIALLRAVNLGAHNRVSMRDLVALLERLGFSDGRSLLQSGNLAFRSEGEGAPSGDKLERLLEKAAEKELGLKTSFFVRTAKEWQKIIKGNPFPEEAERDPAHLVVMPLRDAPGAAKVKALQAAIKGPEQVRAKGRDAYFSYPAGIGRSKLTMPMIEKKLETIGTGRNWNTVLKLAALASE